MKLVIHNLIETHSDLHRKIKNIMPVEHTGKLRMRFSESGFLHLSMGSEALDCSLAEAIALKEFLNKYLAEVPNEMANG